MINEKDVEKKIKQTFYGMKSRCENKNIRAYKSYGGKGIKCLMDISDLRYLWNRDNAILMSRPSIDRINPRGNYEVKNCRFLELKDNLNRRCLTEWKEKIVLKFKLGENVRFNRGIYKVVRINNGTYELSASPHEVWCGITEKEMRKAHR